MSAPKGRVLERIKELDHLHRSRAHGSWQSGIALAASLRFLRVAARQLVKPTRRPRVERVERSAVAEPGAIAITFVGHATVMMTTAHTRLVTDPMLGDSLWGLRRAESAALHADDAAEVSLILISHAHRDHLHLPSLRLLPKSATVVVPPRCAGLVESAGFSRVTVLEPGEELAHRDLMITAVAARHDGARGFPSLGWRGTAGYVVRSAEASVYFAGDTAYFSGFEEIARHLRPQVALLPISGYEPLALRESHMSPLDALYAYEDLGAEVLIPITHGSFPLSYEPLGEPLAWLQEQWALSSPRGTLAALAHGQTWFARGRPLG